MMDDQVQPVYYADGFAGPGIARCPDCGLIQPVRETLCFELHFTDQASGQPAPMHYTGQICPGSGKHYGGASPRPRRVAPPGLVKTPFYPAQTPQVPRLVLRAGMGLVRGLWSFLRGNR